MAVVFAAALGAGLVVAAGAARQHGSPDPQRPTFRAAVNFVRVDVYPRADGKPVADLRAEEFIVQEDGVAQTISTFEHIVIRDGTAPEARTDPRGKPALSGEPVASGAAGAARAPSPGSCVLYFSSLQSR